MTLSSLFTVVSTSSSLTAITLLRESNAIGTIGVLALSPEVACCSTIRFLPRTIRQSLNLVHANSSHWKSGTIQDSKSLSRLIRSVFFADVVIDAAHGRTCFTAGDASIASQRSYSP